ncbi:MAG: hypothetical protein C0483_07475 [Pirellula sp.]|nr:hypothetical protein [Pirellula sp.]
MLKRIDNLKMAKSTTICSHNVDLSVDQQIIEKVSRDVRGVDAIGKCPTFRMKKSVAVVKAIDRRDMHTWEQVLEQTESPLVACETAIYEARVIKKTIKL